MAEPAPNPRSPWVILALIIVALIGGLGGWLLGSRQTPSDQAAIEEIVRNYILEHPEILPQAMERLQARENGKQVASAGDALSTPFPGAVLGNPNGSVTLVEFTDYACGYCRTSVPEVEALIAANPDLKVVIRELPILSPASALRDQTEKREIYEKYGVREYWVVNPKTLESFIYTLKAGEYGLPVPATLRAPIPVGIFPGLSLKVRVEDL